MHIAFPPPRTNLFLSRCLFFPYLRRKERIESDWQDAEKWGYLPSICRGVGGSLGDENDEGTWRTFSIKLRFNFKKSFAFHEGKQYPYCFINS
eukprot:583394-Amorphochlora_amoeboformis.AAC.1